MVTTFELLIALFRLALKNPLLYSKQRQQKKTICIRLLKFSLDMTQSFCSMQRLQQQITKQCVKCLAIQRLFKVYQKCHLISQKLQNSHPIVLKFALKLEESLFLQLTSILATYIHFSNKLIYSVQAFEMRALLIIIFVAYIYRIIKFDLISLPSLLLTLIL